METKQVIVIRKDLKMRRGKEIAQGSHATMSFLTRRIGKCKALRFVKLLWVVFKLTKEEKQWLETSYKKICLSVNSEDELFEIYDKAKAFGLEVHLVTDSGLTEFKGVPTNTCLAIGPHESSRIDVITGHLPLY